jgi:hypothetical protein
MALFRRLKPKGEYVFYRRATKLKCEVIRGFLPVKPHLTYNKRLKLARSRGLNLAKWLHP